MKRTINSTGRKKLTLDQVTIRVEEPVVAGSARRFSAELTGLDDLNLPKDARVYVEPYAKSSFMRFDYGTVANFRAPAETELVDIDAGSPVLFDIKIVDESENVGRILAAGRAIAPVDSTNGDDNRRSLLPVESRDLGELVWQLDMLPGARPVLVLNSRVPNALVRLKSDPLIQGAILPAAIALILDRLLDPECSDTDEEEWVDDWLTWYRAATGTEPDDEVDPYERRALVLSACRSFAVQQRFATRTEGFGDQEGGPIDD